MENELTLAQQLAVATAQLTKVESLYLQLHAQHLALKQEFKALLARTYPNVLDETHARTDL